MKSCFRILAIPVDSILLSIRERCMFEKRPISDEVVDIKQVKVIVKSTVFYTIKSGFTKPFLYFWDT